MMEEINSVVSEKIEIRNRFHTNFFPEISDYQDYDKKINQNISFQNATFLDKY